MATSASESKTTLRGLVGEQVRIARARRRMSQEELARRAGVGTRQVVNLEKTGDVLLATAEKVIDALGLQFTLSDAAA